MESTLRQPDPTDWTRFAELAAAEGWRVPRRELELFSTVWSDHAVVLEQAGEFGGLVTAIPHRHSGWIGNLIVPQALRRRGIGGRLFRAACDKLLGQGCVSLWLTASELGRPLYESSGFRAIDRIVRWVLPPRPTAARGHLATPEDAAARLREADRTAWNEKRTPLLDRLLPHGTPMATEDAVALLQTGDDLCILGPWYSPNLCPRSNRLLLQAVLDGSGSGREIVADVIASSPIAQLLAAAGFERRGETVLMVRGECRADLRMTVSLASLGSFG